MKEELKNDLLNIPIITDTLGRIAYHSLRFRENGDTDFVQYDFDGKVAYITPYRRNHFITVTEP